MINRVKEIKAKGFDMPSLSDNSSFTPTDFSKIKVGIQTLADGTYVIGDLQRANPSLADKKEVLRAINGLNYSKMREISNFFYRTSGIYQRLCRYMAYMYRYDWFITPYVNQKASVSSDKITDGFYKAVDYLDNFGVKKFFGEVALKVIRNGCYYGYLIPRSDRMVVQELPPKYCRSRFNSAEGRPVVEFNMQYFTDVFQNNEQREKMLKLFPEEFSKGYKLFRAGKLVADFPGDTSGWYMLSIDNAIKFNLNGEDFPPFIAVIPAIIDLDNMQGLDRKKMQQELLKIIIQKMPIDKNGDLVFDVDEAQQLHNNAVRMLGRAIGIDVLTTFADVDVADMSSSSSTTAADESMDRVKNAIYDQAGISQLQFNTDGNIALEKSVLNDEATIYNLIQQFEQFLNILLEKFNTNKKISYKAQILGTTIYNYKDLSKLYKEQTQLGYSKMLPQLALGQSQRSILANAFFENDVLDLVNVFIPPMSSNTMSAEAIGQIKNGGSSSSSGSENGAGRPEKADDQKSEKTIMNKESTN